MTWALAMREKKVPTGFGTGEGIYTALHHAEIHTTYSEAPPHALDPSKTSYAHTALQLTLFTTAVTTITTMDAFTSRLGNAACRRPRIPTPR